MRRLAPENAPTRRGIAPTSDIFQGKWREIPLWWAFFNYSAGTAYLAHAIPDSAGNDFSFALPR
jgi:soluble lytic murein transglycosylase-like protein